MAYCDINDLVKVLPANRLIELSDDENTGAWDETVLQGAIDRAAEEMDAYLGVAARLPLSRIPDLLTGLNADLAVCRLYRRVSTDLPDAWKQACRNARQILADMAAGRRWIDLGQDDTAPGVFETGVRPKEFTTQKLNRF